MEVESTKKQSLNLPRLPIAPREHGRLPTYIIDLHRFQRTFSFLGEVCHTRSHRSGATRQLVEQAEIESA